MRHKVRVTDGIGMQYGSYMFRLTSSLLTNSLERYLPNRNPMQTAASPTTTKEPVKNHDASVPKMCSVNAIDN